MVKSEIKPIENEHARQTCFTKRRQSLFNKASELSVLCGAMVGSLVFSTIGTSFSFGHPSIDDVANRFLNNSVASDGSASGGASNDYRWAETDTISNLNMQYSELEQSLRSEKGKKEMLEIATEKEMGQRMMQLLNTNLSELSLEELQEFQKCLEAIHGVVEEKKGTEMPETSQTQGLVPQPPAMEIAPDQQDQFGEHTSANPMASTAPTSSDEFSDGSFDVDDLFSDGDLHEVCGLENFPDNQNQG